MGGLLALLLLGACSDAPAPFAADPGESSPRLSVTGVDADDDGLDDGTEWALANQYAPVLHMPRLIDRSDAYYTWGDWAWPATVSWYLPRVRMRIHHNNCNDHQLLGENQVNATNLLQQVHQRYTLGLFGCSHESPSQRSNEDFHQDDHYFLQAVNDYSTHQGLRNPAQWETYVHSYPNDVGGITLQYWFFYPYNDGVAGFNHEGDWEHVDVKLSSSHIPAAVLYSYHGKLATYEPWQVGWSGGTHPLVWVADGTHANFRSEASCHSEITEGGSTLVGGVVFESCWTDLDARWFTWAGGRGGAQGIQGAGLVALGEKNLPAPGQQWIQYSGLWGERGNFDGTSGPKTPSYQPHWNHQRPSSGGGGGGGGGSECTEGGGPSPTDLQPACPL